MSTDYMRDIKEICRQKMNDEFVNYGGFVNNCGVLNTTKAMINKIRFINKSVYGIDCNSDYIVELLDMDDKLLYDELRNFFQKIALPHFIREEKKQLLIKEEEKKKSQKRINELVIPNGIPEDIEKHIYSFMIAPPIKRVDENSRWEVGKSYYNGKDEVITIRKKTKCFYTYDVWVYKKNSDTAYSYCENYRSKKVLWRGQIAHKNKYEYLNRPDMYWDGDEFHKRYFMSNEERWIDYVGSSK